MSDYISFKKTWSDIFFFEALVECQSASINVKNKYYIDNESINELKQSINDFLSKNRNCFLWQSGEKGNDSNACFSLEFIYKDTCGHILIEVFMELDDGGSYQKHNCCFFINTEYGLLEQFSNKLSTFLKGDIGSVVELCNLTQGTR